MSDYQFHLPTPNAAQELQRLVEQLGASIERAVQGGAEVKRGAADSDEDDFSQEIVISTEQGRLDVQVSWAKEGEKAEVSLSSGGTRGVANYLPLAGALVVGFIADKSPELLPVLRGLRVALGATVGLVAGFLLLGVIALLTARRARVDPELERKVQSAVREVLLARGVTAGTA